MPKVTMEKAKEFLNKISKNDKVAIIHHDDSDGICSGILYYDWCKERGSGVSQFTYSISVTKLKNLDLKIFNKIIICDLASGVIGEELNAIKNKEIFYTDHHPKEHTFPKEILELITTDDGYIPSSRTATELTGIKPWLSLIGTISDSGQYYPENEEFIARNLNNLNMTLDEFQENMVNVVTNFLIYSNKDYDKAFDTLDKIQSIGGISKLKKYSDIIENEVQKFIELYDDKKEMLGNVNFYYFEPKFSVKPPVCGRISANDLNQIYIFASPKKNSEYITLSARNTSKDMNMIELLEKGLKGLKNSSSGGHFSAAGGRIQAKDLEKFKQNIMKFVKR